MVIGNLYFECVAIIPHKTDSKLIVDADGMLAFPVAMQSMELVARRSLQIREADSNVNHLQLSPCNLT